MEPRVVDLLRTGFIQTHMDLTADGRTPHKAWRKPNSQDRFSDTENLGLFV